MFPSSFFFADKRLLNHNITTFQVQDLDACELLCYHNANCVSINFESKTYKCDLNNATHIRHDDEFVDTVGYLYRGADVSFVSVDIVFYIAVCWGHCMNHVRSRKLKLAVESAQVSLLS